MIGGTSKASLPTGVDPDALMDEICARVGPVVVQSVQSVLGTPDIYTLSPAYSKRKAKLPGFKRYRGKAPDQPLIFSGAMYEAVTVERVAGSADTLGLSVSENLLPAVDYPDRWEKKTEFLDKGLALAEPKLAALVETALNVTFK